MVGLLLLSRVCVPRRLRLRFLLLQELRWDFPPQVRRILPVADFLNRLRAARLVFCFGICLLSFHDRVWRDREFWMSCGRTGSQP